MSRVHTKALVALCEAIPAFTGRTFVSVVTAGFEAPYLVLHPANGTNSQGRVTGPRVTKHPRFTGHIVGVTADQTQLLTDILEAALFPGGRGVVVSVVGESAKPLWFESPVPVQVSTDPLPQIVFQVVECGWRSEPV